MLLKRLLIGVVIAVGLLLSVALGLFSYAILSKINTPADVRIGYFHSGRTVLLLRAYINRQFEKQNASVQLLTRTLKNGAYVEITKDYRAAAETPEFGKVPESALLDGIMRGEFDGIVIGEGSFVTALASGMPLVAVAELGHDSANRPSNALVLRSDVIIENPSDFVGKKLGTRNAGPTDSIIVREFLENIGVPPEEVTLLDQVPEGVLLNRIANKSLDGGYLYVRLIERLINNNRASVYVYRKLDWIDPELSYALLVFRQDFVEKYPKEVEKVVRGYMKQIQYEHGLSKEERMRDPGPESRGILQMELDFMGLDLPQYDPLPTVSINLLEQIQDLLFKYKFINIKTDLGGYIDNSFVEKVSAEIPTK